MELRVEEEVKEKKCLDNYGYRIIIICNERIRNYLYDIADYFNY